METEDVQFARVALPTRLDNRVMDLRVSQRCSFPQPRQQQANHSFSLANRPPPTKPSSASSPPSANSSANTSTLKDSSRSTRPNSKVPRPNRALQSSRSSTLTGRRFWRSRPSWRSRWLLRVIWRGFMRLLLVGFFFFFHPIPLLGAVSSGDKAGSQ